jgi:hypothetical protein
MKFFLAIFAFIFLIQSPSFAEIWEPGVFENFGAPTQWVIKRTMEPMRNRNVNFLRLLLDSSQFSGCNFAVTNDDKHLTLSIYDESHSEMHLFHVTFPNGLLGTLPIPESETEQAYWVIFDQDQQTYVLKFYIPDDGSRVTKVALQSLTKTADHKIEVANPLFCQ